MPEDVKPVFDPNKPFTPENISAKPAFNPHKPFKATETITVDPLTKLQNKQDATATFIETINNIPDLDDSKKETIKDLTLKGVKGEELSNAILTLQGKHPKQNGMSTIFGTEVSNNSKYYFDDKGIPRPLKNNERPPVGHEIASIWGSQKDANDDNPFTDLAKTIWNVLPSSAENVIDLLQTGYEGVTNKESEWLNTLKNSANYLKATKDEDLQKSLFNTQGIDEWSDLLDSKRIDVSPEALWGTVNGLLGSVGEFYVGGSAASKAAKGALGVADLGKKTQIVANMVGSTLTNLGEVRDAATEAGLTGRDRALFTSVVAPIVSAIDVKWGLGTKMFGSPVAKEEKNAFLKALGKGVPRDAEGKITKDGMQELLKVTATGYTQVAKKIGQLTTKDVLAEGGQEALQQFVQNAGEQLWDKLTPAEKKKFGTDAFSPESFGEYIQNGMAGLIGGTPTVVAYNKAKAMAKQEAQNNSAFDIAKGDLGKIYAFHKNLNNELSQGKITKQEADEAAFKVNAYKEYYNQTRDTKLKDEDKKRVFELTFEKANLENQIPSEYEEDKLNAIEQAKIQTLKKEAKDIQKEVDEILLKSQVLKKETTSAKKTVEEIDKNLTPEPKEGEKKVEFVTGIKDLFEKHKGELAEVENKPKKPEVVETRIFEEIPTSDWNQKRAWDKFKILSEHLDTSNEVQVGEMKLMKEGNDTVHIKLPNDKYVIFASSATDTKSKLRGHLHIENLPKDFDGHKVVIKPVRLTTGRIVLPVYNAETGKHVGYVREEDKGKANEKYFENRALKMGEEKAQEIEEKENEELQHLKTVKLTKNEIEAINRPSGENQPSVETISNKNENTQPETEKIVEAINEGQHTTEGDAVTRTESTTRNNEEISGEVSQTRLKTKGKPRHKRKIKEPIRLKALEIEANTPYDLALQFFIKNGLVEGNDLLKYFKGDVNEKKSRWTLWSYKHGLTRQEIAHELWEANSDLKYDTSDYLNAVEEVLSGFDNRTDMAQNLADRWKEKINPMEKAISEKFTKAENEGIENTFNDIVDEIEKLGNDEITKLSENQNEFYIWGNKIIDIIRRKEGDEDVFQKQKESTPTLELDKHEAILKVTQHIQSVLPNIKVIYDKKLDAAGKWSPSNKTLSINPYFAGIDTPIHEAGHILIDVLGGMNNKVIANAIKQLKGTELWSITKERYPELNEQNLGYEVLAEAIGREGEGIFDKESEKNVFMKYLEYIFNRLKQLFGIDENIAKSLAKQIVWGINLKTDEFNIQDEQLHKKFEELSKEQQIKKLTLNFEQYAREVLKRDIVAEAENLNRVNQALENTDLTEEEINEIEKLKQVLENKKKQDLRAWFEYREDMKWAATLDEDIRELENKATNGKITEQEYIDGMIELYNVVNAFQEAARKTVESNIMSKLGYAIFRNQKGELSKNEKFIEEIANKADISAKDVWVKNLGHMTEKVPELQAFGKMFDEASFDKVADAKEKKNTFEKLGTVVIKELNKGLDIVEKGKALAFKDSAKYFDWIDNGKGEMLTVEEAENNGLSEAQINFLKFYRELIAEHKNLVDGDIYNMPLQVLKTDPSFREAYKQNGITQAFSNFLGTNYNLKQVRIKFKDPDTKIESVMPFGDIENNIVEYGKKDAVSKVKSLALLLKYNRQARLQLKKGVNVDEKENPLLVKNNSQYSVDNKGVLSSKFDKPRDKDRGYSKDFYRAGIEFIDDMTHVKHYSKLVPIINAIEHLNDKGYGEHLAKPNVVKYVKEWKDLHLFKNPKQILPEIDLMLRFLRFMTSSTTMLFNVPAGIMNLAIGVYNNWRAENGKTVGIGHKRLFGELGKHKVDRNYGGGLINPYAMDILRKYDVVSVDYSSNPKLYAGQLFSELGHALTRYGEFQIQGSLFLGLMTDEDYNSFEYKKNEHGVDELVVKEGVDEKALKNRLIGYKNRVSDIQGKYSDKDQRNIQNNEAGKVGLQFRLWALDWWAERYGSEYITRDGKTKRGSWREMFGDAYKDLKSELKEANSTPEKLKVLYNNKNFMSNLKGAMTVVLFWSLANQGDDDKKKKTALDAENALGNLLFIFDTDQLKFMVKRPVAAMGTLEKFVDIVGDISDLEGEKQKNLLKDIRKLLPAKKSIDIIEKVIE